MNELNVGIPSVILVLFALACAATIGIFLGKRGVGAHAIAPNFASKVEELFGLF